MPNYNGTVIPIRLASFSVRDVRQDPRFGLVSVAGFLKMWITGSDTMAYDKGFPADTPEFHFDQGLSSLKIFFKGIYAESENNEGGERIMCLLGKMLPPSQKSDFPPRNGPKSSLGASRNQFSQDDKILMILRYPKYFSLTSRTIHGEMTSLRDRIDSLYFDKIRLSTMLGPYSSYQFQNWELVNKTCSPYPYPNKLLSKEMNTYHSSVCDLLGAFSSRAFFIVPNWKCNYTVVNCNRLGPFNFSDVLIEANSSSEGVKLFMQDVRCEAQDNGNLARVSAVIRAMPTMEEQIVGRQISGLDSMTLAVEGIWNSVGGQLCMVGCLGSDDKTCEHRVLMHFPLTFTISQRNIVVGTISSSNSKAGSAVSYHPLTFERRISPWEFQLFDYMSINISYSYTQIRKAGAFLEKKEYFDFNLPVKKSLLRYPKVEGKEATAFSLSNLAEDLSISSRIVADSQTYARIHLDFFTIGSLFVHSSARNISEVELHTPERTEIPEKELILNISAMFTISTNNQKRFSNITNLFLEGIYNPASGKMYLIGCRDVHASLNVLIDSSDLQNGLDCLIQCEVDYPPVIAHWLVGHNIKISISSQRNEDDPLHFSPIEFKTFPITYHTQREDMLSQIIVEGTLQFLIMSLAVAFTFSQLVFVKTDASAPFISMVMLGILAIGYGIPLISGAEALLFGRKSKSHGFSFSDSENNYSLLVRYFVKILSLAAFLLTLRLVQKVHRSRRRLSSAMSTEPRRVPSDRWVFYTSLCIHIIGFFAAACVNSAWQPSHKTENYFEPDGMTETYSPPTVTINKSRGWGTELEEYVGMAQDFFLLPQVIGNLLWQLDGKPLRKTYYIGVTILRILPHVYDYLKAPAFNIYGNDEGWELINPNMDFYSKFGDIAIPFVAILLTIIVYAQQRWNSQNLYRSLGLERFRFLALRSKAYEKLPTVPHEAELVRVDENEDQRS